MRRTAGRTRIGISSGALRHFRCGGLGSVQHAYARTHKSERACITSHIDHWRQLGGIANMPAHLLSAARRSNMASANLPSFRAFLMSLRSPSLTMTRPAPHVCASLLQISHLPKPVPRHMLHQAVWKLTCASSHPQETLHHRVPAQVCRRPHPPPRPSSP